MSSISLVGLSMSMSACLEAEDTPFAIEESQRDMMSGDLMSGDVISPDVESHDQSPPRLDLGELDLEPPLDSEPPQDASPPPLDMTPPPEDVAPPPQDLAPPPMDAEPPIRPEDIERTWLGVHTHIIAPECEGCHNDTSSSGGLSLSFGQYDALVNQRMRSIARLNLRLIEAGDPAASYLLHKMTAGSDITGGLMPPGPRLDEGYVEVIRSWIELGAPQ